MANSSASTGPLINKNTGPNDRIDSHGIAQKDGKFALVMEQGATKYIFRSRPEQVYSFVDFRAGGFRKTRANQG
jgi:hypothetical protein